MNSNKSLVKTCESTSIQENSLVKEINAFSATVRRLRMKGKF